MRLDLRHLRTVVVVADTGSISTAARDLDVAQPTLTNQLRRIEQSCGGPLFDRTPTGVVPTDLGRDVLRHARVVLTRLDELVRAGGDGPGPSTLRILGAPGVLHRVLPAVLADRLHVSVEARTCADAGALAAVRDGSCELAVVTRWPHLSRPLFDGLVTHVVERGALRLLLPADDEPPIGLDALADRPWILRADADARRAVLVQCRTAGFTPSAPLTADDPAVVAALVAGGYGVAIEPGPIDTAGVTAHSYPDASWYTDELVARPDTAGHEIITGLCAGRRRRRPHDTPA